MARRRSRPARDVGGCETQKGSQVSGTPAYGRFPLHFGSGGLHCDGPFSLGGPRRYDSLSGPRTSGSVPKASRQSGTAQPGGYNPDDPALVRAQARSMRRRPNVSEVAWRPGVAPLQPEPAIPIPKPARLVPGSSLAQLERLLEGGVHPRELTPEQRREALACYRRLSKHQQESLKESTLLALAHLLEMAGMTSQALNLYRRLLNEHPEAPDRASIALEAAHLAFRAELVDLARRFVRRACPAFCSKQSTARRRSWPGGLRNRCVPRRRLPWRCLSQPPLSLEAAQGDRRTRRRG